MLKKQYDKSLMLRGSPLICLFEGFASGEECDSLIKAAHSRLNRALVSDQSAGVKSKGRTNQHCWIDHNFSPAIQKLADRISNIVDLPISHAESFQVVHYAEGQNYAPHFDAWQADTPAGDRCMAKGGQRLITSLIYLEGVDEGGGTTFPRLNLDVQAVRGNMLLFHNCEPFSNIRHPASLHGGQPVLSGEKWACNLWFRERPYRSLNSKNSRQVPLTST